MRIDHIFSVVSLIGVLVGCRASDEEQIRGVMQGSLQAYGEEDIDEVMSYTKSHGRTRMCTPAFSTGETMS